jgi:Cdc6-like AAA superfamily ATPase
MTRVDVNWLRKTLGPLAGDASKRAEPQRTTPLGGAGSKTVALNAAPAPGRPRRDGPEEAGASPEPGFMANAGDQLLGSPDGTLDKIRMKLRAILTPSQPVKEPKAFAGRRKVLAQLIGALEDQRLHVVLYGSRGMGKTSLLHVLTQRARDARYQVVYGSCGVGTTFSDLFRSLCSEIPLRFHSSFRSSGREGDAGQTLDRLLPPGDLSARQVAEILSELIGTRVLMIVDEFDRSGTGDFREKIADLIKNLSDRAARAQLIIAGVGTNLAELIEHIPSIQRNIIGLQIPLMSEEEVRQLLQIAHSHTGLTFSDEASDLIVRVSRGWPYVASLLAHHAALAAVRKKSLLVELEEAQEAIRQAAEEVAGRLGRETVREVAAARAQAGPECLAAAAKAHIAHGGEFTGDDLEEQSCAPALAALVESNLLIQANEDRFGRTYEFRDVTVPLHLWLSGVSAQI